MTPGKKNCIITVIVLISFVLCFVHLYKTGLQEIDDKAIAALADAIDKELDHRFAQLNIPITIIPKNDNREYGNTMITNVNGEVIFKVCPEKDKFAITNLFEKRAKQTITTGYMAIDVSAVDSLWLSELKSRNVKCKTAICITSLNYERSCSDPSIKSEEYCYKTSYAE